MRGLLNLTHPGPPCGHRPRPSADNLLERSREFAARSPWRCVMSWTGWPWSPDHRAAQLAAWGLHSQPVRATSRPEKSSAFRRLLRWGQREAQLQGRARAGQGGPLGQRQCGLRALRVLAPRRQHRKVAERCACERGVRPSLRRAAWGGLQGRDADEGLG